MPPKILKLPDVTEATALSRSTIYAYIKQERFPAPIKIGITAVGWLESEVSEWIAEQASRREKGGAHV